MKKRNARIALLFINLVLLVACSTHQSKALRRVQIGMDKASVLEIAGNPTRISRHLGQDRWSYENMNSDSTAAEARTTYVYFAEGRVTHVGPANEGKNDKPVTPEKSTANEFKPVGE